MRKNIKVVRLSNGRMYGIVLLMFAVLLAGRALAGSTEAEQAMAPALVGVKITIDAGHGGWDPGKVSGKLEEQTINLAVAQSLAEYCRSAGALVTLTRAGMDALADNKQADMAQRVAAADDADIFISLHCNSYPAQPAAHGAQVFYQSDNPEGKLLAELVQAELCAQTDTTRTALAHADSYLLKNISGAAILCEMGFLSNSEEAELLSQREYQWQLAWTLFTALSAYRQ